jgi:hypothetical protein
MSQYNLNSSGSISPKNTHFRPFCITSHGCNTHQFKRNWCEWSQNEERLKTESMSQGTRDKCVPRHQGQMERKIGVIRPRLRCGINRIFWEDLVVFICWIGILNPHFQELITRRSSKRTIWLYFLCHSILGVFLFVVCYEISIG